MCVIHSLHMWLFAPTIPDLMCQIELLTATPKPLMTMLQMFQAFPPVQRYEALPTFVQEQFFWCRPVEFIYPSISPSAFSNNPKYQQTHDNAIQSMTTVFTPQCAFFILATVCNQMQLCRLSKLTTPKKPEGPQTISSAPQAFARQVWHTEGCPTCHLFKKLHLGHLDLVNWLLRYAPCPYISRTIIYQQNENTTRTAINLI